MAKTNGFAGFNAKITSLSTLLDTNQLIMKHLRMLWRLWAKALGQKASKKDSEADQVAWVRTFIFATYLITNAFIMAGVIRHWNDQTQIFIEIHENSNSNKDSYTEGWNNLGMGRDTRVESIYYTGTIKNRTGEFE